MTIEVQFAGGPVNGQAMVVRGVAPWLGTDGRRHVNPAEIRVQHFDSPYPGLDRDEDFPFPTPVPVVDLVYVWRGRTTAAGAPIYEFTPPPGPSGGGERP